MSQKWVRKEILTGLAAIAAAVLLFSSPEPSMAQDAPAKAGPGKGGKGGKAKAPSRPTPRNADGRIILGPPPGEKGVWQGNAGAVLVRNLRPAANTPPPPPTNVMAVPPVNPTIDEIPFQPWARALLDFRQESLTADDPHVRCKSSGGARLYHTPYGFEIIEVPEMQQILMAGVGGPHTYRVIYMDGRPHPPLAEIDPGYHGHSIGRWEGKDKLVVDTVGFNLRFWFAREGYPHTEQLHTIETFERPTLETLVYRITVDDPGAYTAQWTAGWSIPWSATNEMYEYICQENNRDSRHMFGGDSSQ
jgi:hypothetical protein